MTGNKKKFYKRWWFWLAIVLIALAAYGNEIEKKEVAEEEAAKIKYQEEEKQREKDEESKLKEEESKHKEEEKNKQKELGEKLQKLEDEKLDLDWDKIIESTIEDVANPEFFGYIKDIYINVDKDKKEVVFTAVLEDSTSKDIAVDFADILIRRFSSNVVMQNRDLKAPESEYLGEVFDYYNIAIGIAPLSQVDNNKEWFVYDNIHRKVHRNPRPKK